MHTKCLFWLFPVLEITWHNSSKCIVWLYCDLSIISYFDENEFFNTFLFKVNQRCLIPSITLIKKEVLKDLWLVIMQSFKQIIATSVILYEKHRCKTTKHFLRFQFDCNSKIIICGLSMSMTWEMFPAELCLEFIQCFFTIQSFCIFTAVLVIDLYRHKQRKRWHPAMTIICI